MDPTNLEQMKAFLQATGASSSLVNVVFGDGIPGRRAQAAQAPHQQGSPCTSTLTHVFLDIDHATRQ